MNQFRSQALRNLLGNDVAWKYLGDELIIYTEGVSAPTEEAINAEIAKLEAEENAKIAEAAAKRQALLERLGITEEEAKLLLG